VAEVSAAGVCSGSAEAVDLVVLGGELGQCGGFEGGEVGELKFEKNKAERVLEYNLQEIAQQPATWR